MNLLTESEGKQAQSDISLFRILLSGLPPEGAT